MGGMSGMEASGEVDGSGCGSPVTWGDGEKTTKEGEKSQQKIA